MLETIASFQDSNRLIKLLFDGSCYYLQITEDNKNVETYQGSGDIKDAIFSLLTLIADPYEIDLEEIALRSAKFVITANSDSDYDKNQEN